MDMIGYDPCAPIFTTYSPQNLTDPISENIIFPRKPLILSIFQVPQAVWFSGVFGLIGEHQGRHRSRLGHIGSWGGRFWVFYLGD